MTKYVQHDGKRWKIVGEIMLDDKPAFELRRRVPIGVLTETGRLRITGFSVDQLVAYVEECQPDSHEPVRVIRDAKAVLRFYPKLGTLDVRLTGKRTKVESTVHGVYKALCWQKALTRSLGKGLRKKKLGKKR